MNIITENTIALANGFEWRELIAFFFPDNTVESVETVGCHTWHDDAAASGQEIPLVGRKGVHIHIHSQHGHKVLGFFGHTAEELASPTPVSGWTTSWSQHSKEWMDVETLADYLSAIGRGDFTPWASMADGVHKMPHVWGYQGAASFALVIAGKLIECATGAGENMPYLTADEAGCIKERRLLTSTDREDKQAEEHLAWANVNVALNRGWSNEWQDAAAHLRSCYRMGQNPLPTLRNKYGGTWEWLKPNLHREDAKPGEIRFTELEKKANDGTNGFRFWENVWGNWQVSHIPAK